VAAADFLDAHLIVPGDLLFVINPRNSQGDPTWAHDFVVLGRVGPLGLTPGPPRSGMFLGCLGIASVTAARPFDATRMVMLAHGPGPTGDPVTGLVNPSAVQIDWPELIPLQQVKGKSVVQAVGVRWNKKAGDTRRRHVDAQTLAAIYRLLNVRAGQPPTPPAPGATA
jgi:hypothetical protein